MLSLYREDLGKRKSGAPIYVGEMTFYVRRWGDEESLKARHDLERELFGPFHKWQQSDDSLLVAHWLAEYGVTGWEDVVDHKGNPTPYSESAKRRIFLNPEYFLSLNSILFANANNFENYLHDEAREDLEAVKKG